MSLSKVVQNALLSRPIIQLRGSHHSSSEKVLIMVSAVMRFIIIVIFATIVIMLTSAQDQEYSKKFTVHSELNLMCVKENMLIKIKSATWNLNVSDLSLTPNERRAYTGLEKNQTEKLGKLCDNKRICREYLNCGLNVGNKIVMTVRYSCEVQCPNPIFVIKNIAQKPDSGEIEDIAKDVAKKRTENNWSDTDVMTFFTGATAMKYKRINNRCEFESKAKTWFCQKNQNGIFACEIEGTYYAIHHRLTGELIDYNELKTGVIPLSSLAG